MSPSWRGIKGEVTPNVDLIMEANKNNFHLKIGLKEKK